MTLATRALLLATLLLAIRLPLLYGNRITEFAQEVAWVLAVTALVHVALLGTNGKFSAWRSVGVVLIFSGASWLVPAVHSREEVFVYGAVLIGVPELALGCIAFGIDWMYEQIT